MAPRVRTERLVLERLDAERARRLADGDTSGMTAGPGWPDEETPLIALSVLNSGAAMWLITRDGAVIGECGTKYAPRGDGTVEIGYGLAPPWRSAGYGTEAVGALLEWLRGLPGCRRVVAEIHAANAPSRRLAERLGFTVDRNDPPYVWYALVFG